MNQFRCEYDRLLRAHCADYSALFIKKREKVLKMLPTQTSLGLICSLTFLLIVILPLTLDAQNQTVGLFQYDSASFEGYTLFSPIGSQATYLIDNYGRLVHSWESEYIPNLSVYLLENGDLLRSSKTQDGITMEGGVQILAWDGTVVWEFPFFGTDYIQHHDIEPLPNGNILLLVSEDKTYAEAVAMGRDPALMNDTILSPEYIVEVAQTGPTSYNIVWEWHFWNHLIQDFDSTKTNYGAVAEHPELLDINYAKHSRADWIHANAVAYNPELDQIAISSRTLNELYIIDHSTTSAEAAGHSGGNSGMGGDILYRWGNPRSYGAGTEQNQKFFAEHDVQWIKPGLPGEGHLLIFNNGADRPGGKYSTVEEIVPPIDEYGNYQQPDPGTPFGPAGPIWIYQAHNPTSFYCDNISGAQRLPNGSTLICSGPNGLFFEVTPDGDIIWEYKNPVTNVGILEQGEPLGGKANSVFRCYRYASDYPGLIGKDLTPGALIELYPITIAGAMHTPQMPTVADSIIVTAHITGENEITSVELYIDTGSGYAAVDMYDDGLHHDGPADDDIYGVVVPPLQEVTTAYYYINAEDNSAIVQLDPPNAAEIVYSFVTTAGSYICGDANSDETVNVSDAVYIINYVFAGGEPPDPLEAADANCDSTCNVSDAVYIINYVFTGGNEPCDSDGDGIPDC
jgi:hypothetical protein